MTNSKKMFFLSGLPRTGSTVFRAIVEQNPKFHAEGISSVCHLLGVVHHEMNSTLKKTLAAVGRENKKQEIQSAIINAYYSDVEKPYILDLHRMWTRDYNLNLIKTYITKDPKIIVMLRPCAEIIRSFKAIYQKSKMSVPEINARLVVDVDVLAEQCELVSASMKENNGEYIFVTYKDLVENPSLFMKNAYSFLGVEDFEHDFSNITLNHREDDSVYSVPDLHKVRTSLLVDSSENDVEIGERYAEIAASLDAKIGLGG